MPISGNHQEICSSDRPVFVTYDAFTLTWDEGFNGGYNNTEFTVEYRQQRRHGNDVSTSMSTPRYYECLRRNPCNVTGLLPNTQYRVMVKASNIRGESKYSDGAIIATKIDVSKIPKPVDVHFEKSTAKASFHVDRDTSADMFTESSNPLPLVAKIELENSDGTWSHYEGIKMASSGAPRQFAEIEVRDREVSNLRVRLCLETNELLCGPYSQASIVDVRPQTSSSGSRAATESTMAAPWIIVVIVFIVLLATVAMIIGLRCFCSKSKKISRKKGNVDCACFVTFLIAGIAVGIDY